VERTLHEVGRPPVSHLLDRDHLEFGCRSLLTLWYSISLVVLHVPALWDEHRLLVTRAH
jgi:hypothetical protein